MISQGSTPGEIILPTPQTREYIDWQWPLSCVHSVIMVFSAQLGDVGGEGGEGPHPFTHPFFRKTSESRL